MKEKVLAKLKVKFPGLSNEFLGFIADKIAAKTTDENAIEGAITELDEKLPIKDQADFFQRESDRRVTAATKEKDAEIAKLKGTEPPTPPGPPAPPNPPAPGDGDSELKKQLNQLALKLDAFEKKESSQKLHEALMKKMAEKKIPALLAKGRTVEKEEDIDTVLAEIETDYTQFKQDHANEGFSSSSIPIGGEGRTDNVDKDIADWAAKKTPGEQKK